MQKLTCEKTGRAGLEGRGSPAADQTDATLDVASTAQRRCQTATTPS